jgi:hypothetical protein
LSAPAIASKRILHFFLHLIHKHFAINNLNQLQINASLESIVDRKVQIATMGTDNPPGGGDGP